MNTLAILLFAAVGALSAQNPCSPLDDPPFLHTKPTLFMAVDEASAEDTMYGGTDRHMSELRLNGVVGGTGSDGIVLEIMDDFRFLNPADHFKFMRAGITNYLKVKQGTALDRDGPTAAVDDDTNTFSFTLKCSLYSNTSAFEYYDVRILVRDINDNDPQILTNVTEPLVINELTPIDAVVTRIQAEDKDLTSNLSFTLQPAADRTDISGHFDLDPVTGELKVKSSLDFEQFTSGSLNFRVSDGSRIVTSKLNVLITDGDDQGPVYVYSGCWVHDRRCAWPKYTSTTTLTKNVPIQVLPVPNKNSGAVKIRARDGDAINSPIKFSIASTIPPGSEGDFTVTTAAVGDSGEHEATITPHKTFSVQHGFEIFLKAEEQTEQKRSVITMIFFEDPNHACASRASAAASDDDDNFSSPVVGLIAAVSVISAVVACLVIVIVVIVTRRKASPTDVTMNSATTNGNAAF